MVPNPFQETLDMYKEMLPKRESMKEQQIARLADFNKELQTLSATYVSGEQLKDANIELLKFKIKSTNRSIIMLDEEISGLKKDINSLFVWIDNHVQTGDCHYLIQFPKWK